MIDILIVEDSAEKASIIRDFICTLEYVDANKIDVVTDARTARERLGQKSFHLLILDVQIPKVFGGDLPTKDGGIELLASLSKSGRVNLPLHVIGLTAYDDAIDLAAAPFAEQLWGLLKYTQDGDGWRRQLRTKIDYLTSAIQASTFNARYMFDVAIVTALLDPEFAAIKRLDYNWEPLSLKDDITEYQVGSVLRDTKTLKIVAASAAQMGMAASAVLASKIIYRFRPRIIAMTGITAGIKDKANIGDVLAADSSWDYGSGKFVAKGKTRQFLPDPRQVDISGALQEQLLALSQRQEVFDQIKREWPGSKPEESLKLVVGPLPSGAAVVADPLVVKQLKDRNRKMIGLDMEGYSIFLAAKYASKPYPEPLVIKSVTDFADESKGELDHLRPYAAFTSAKTLDFIIRNLFDCD